MIITKRYTTQRIAVPAADVAVFGRELRKLLDIGIKVLRVVGRSTIDARIAGALNTFVRPE